MEFSNYQYNYESFIKAGILMTADTTFIIQAETILLLMLYSVAFAMRNYPV